MTAAEGTELNRPGMRWYVLRVGSNQESKVRDAIERKVKIEGYEEYVGRILVPTIKEKKRKAGKMFFVEHKLYPGYVFVEMKCQPDGSINEQVWFTFKETAGVGDFIGTQRRPSPMQDHEARAMLEASKKPDEAELKGVELKKGDRIKITEGPFEGYEGEVDDVDQKHGMVTVVVTIFGRSTQLDVEQWQLEKVDAMAAEKTAKD